MCFICSGVYLKWLSLDHVYISSSGYLVIGELSGACIADHPYHTSAIQQQKLMSEDKHIEHREQKVKSGNDSRDRIQKTSLKNIKAAEISFAVNDDHLNSEDVKKRKHSSSKHLSDSKTRHQIDDFDSHKRSNSYMKQKDKKRESEDGVVISTASAAPPTLPHLALTPPEIILGDLSPRSPSILTNVWLAGALAVYIASGKPITKVF